MYNVDNQLYNDNDLDITGPRTFGRAFNRFFNLNETDKIKRG